MRAPRGKAMSLRADIGPRNIRILDAQTKFIQCGKAVYARYASKTRLVSIICVIRHQ